MLPDDVRRLILTSIPTVPHLEALLLLRAQPSIVWDASATATRLYISEKVAEQVLAELAAGGFIAANGDPPQYRYHPSSPEQGAAVDQLAAAHARDLLEVTDLIHRKSAHLFADAFKFRRDS